jgi:hypothetical protein
MLPRRAGLQAGGHHLDTHRTPVLVSNSYCATHSPVHHSHDLCTHKRSSELIGEVYLRLKGKRNRLDTSRGKGAYRCPATRKPVWESRRSRREDAEGEG